ncbi:unnamed protein product [Strongylus vulgaris]|uniref:MOSC domain-containing protein n=1 Tax=Strongylus vulgaris TaxID=40348 RepID=A0A3P7I9X6_STRVU|nr:unnamed protein product [Strongylus vulgaris]
MYEKGLYSNRACVIERKAWNAEIPLRTDKTAFADDAPYMINTQASLDDLNTRLEEKVVIEHFRPVIFVDKCAAWDEDKWLSVHIGDVALQCLKPCLRTQKQSFGGIQLLSSLMKVNITKLAIERDLALLFITKCKKQKKTFEE